MAGDANYASVSLLLHCDGSNGSTTFTDNSPTPKTVTPQSGAKISTANSKFGGSSMLLNGTSDYLTLSTEVNLVSGGDFTVEGWFKPPGATGGGALLSHRNAAGTQGWMIQLLYSAGEWLWVWQQWQPGYVSSSASIVGVSASSSDFVFCQFTRSGNNHTGYVGGVSGGTYTNATRPVAATGTTPTIGRDSGAASSYWAGNMDDLRVTVGASRGTTTPLVAFSNGLGEVAGTIYDSAGAPCARAVRAYRRDTGVLVATATSDAGTGAYLVAAPTLNELDIVVLDDAVSGTYYNDQIIRVIPA